MAETFRDADLSVQALQRANAVLTARLKLLSAYPSRSLEELLTAAVDEAVALTGSAIGFLHHVDEAAGAVTFQVWSTGTAEGYCKAVGRGELHRPLDEAGAWADCVRGKSPVIINDYGALTHKKGLPEGHAQLLRVVCIPVLRVGGVVAILGVGNKAADYDGEDVEAVNLLADLSWDITERKRAEERLTRIEARARMAQVAAGVGVFEWDIRGNSSDWSEELYRLYGVEPGSVENPSERWEEWVYPQDLAGAKALVARCFAERRGRLRGEHRIVRQSDGEVRWLKNDAIVTYDGEGAPLRMIGSSQDVTHLRAAILALTERELLLAEAQRVGNLGIYDYDLITDEFYASEQLDDLFGITPDYPHTLVGWMNLIAPDHREKMAAHFASAAEKRVWYDMEYQIVRPSDGERRWVYGTGQFRTDEDGGVHMVGTIQDIDRRKRLEAEDAALKEQLAQAQKMEALGTLAGGIAHDFNNILAAVIGFTELTLENPTAAEDVAENMKTVLTASLRARDLVSQILTFARKGTGSANLLRLDLEVAETLGMLRSTTPSNIAIEAKLDLPLSIFADVSQIHQIVMNLCTNAGQALKETGGTLTVTLDRLELAENQPPPSSELKPGKYAVLTVADDGPGIPAEALPHVFEPFFTTRAKGSGTGMGLATVHGVAHASGGAVTVASRYGEGAVFTVYLPLAEESAAARIKMEAAPLRGGGRVLVVDDEPAVVAMAGKMLSHLGYEPVATTSPKEAWALFSSDPEAFAAVVTDQTMPEMLGIELAELVRALNPKVPVIICTGYSETLSEGRCAKADVAALLAKPVAMNILAETLAEATGRKLGGGGGQ